jgi:hypothetical protein
MLVRACRAFRIKPAEQVSNKQTTRRLFFNIKYNQKRYILNHKSPVCFQNRALIYGFIKLFIHKHTVNSMDYSIGSRRVK